MNDAVMEAPAAQKPKAKFRFGFHQIKADHIGQCSRIWRCVLRDVDPKGLMPEDLLHEETFGARGLPGRAEQSILKFDQIVVIAADESWKADYEVTDVAHGLIWTDLVHKKSFEKKPAHRTYRFPANHGVQPSHEGYRPYRDEPNGRRVWLSSMHFADFESAAHANFTVLSAPSLDAATTLAARFGASARAFRVRPSWSRPDEEWVRANPALWQRR